MRGDGHFHEGDGTENFSSLRASTEQKSLTYFSTGCVVFPSCQPAAQMQVERRIFLNISIEKSIQAHWSTLEHTRKMSEQ